MLACAGVLGGGGATAAASCECSLLLPGEDTAGRHNKQGAANGRAERHNMLAKDGCVSYARRRGEG